MVYKFYLIPIAVAIIWTSFSLLNLTGSDGNEDLLNDGTSVLYEQYEDIPIHCGAYPELKECIDGAQKSNLDAVLLFGNSQLHAVNNISNKSELVALRFHKTRRKVNEYVVTISYGNANFEEINWAMENLLDKIKVKRIFIACVFDDMREVGLRPEMLETNQLQENAINQDFKNSYIFPEIPIQDISESLINEFFTDSPAWNTRHELKYRINVNLRKMRNFVFGITPETKRKILPHAYERNINYFSQILKKTSEKGIETIAYIAPILHDEGIPYDKNEYSKYKNDIKDITDFYGAKFINLEKIVPNEAWGLKQNTQLKSTLEKDYMHFTETGHIILAKSLNEIIDG